MHCQEVDIVAIHASFVFFFSNIHVIFAFFDFSNLPQLMQFSSWYVFSTDLYKLFFILS